MTNNPKLVRFVEPYLEVPEEERIRKTAVPVTQPLRLERPAKARSWAQCSGPWFGLVALLLMYAANLYAGYEIAICRIQPVALSVACPPCCRWSAPSSFSSCPRAPPRGHPRAAVEEGSREPSPAGKAAPAPSVPGGRGLTRAPAAPAAESAPQTQVYQRGQFTFNRRFFETKFPDFFGAVRRDAEKDRVLLIRTPHGAFVASRITRITANDLHVETHRGRQTEEAMIPFGEIQEVRLKHEDA